MNLNFQYAMLLVTVFTTSSINAAEPPSLEVVLSKNPEVTLMDGSRVPLSKVLLPGKPTLIQFWATWCAPCIESMPSFIELNQRYRDQGLQVIGLTVDDPVENRQKVVNLINKLGIDYDNAFVSDETFRFITDEKRVAVSRTLVYNKNGKVIKYFAKKLLLMHKHIERAVKDALEPTPQ